MIIDFHAHAFNDKIVQRAMQTLIKNSGGVRPHTDGSIQDILRKQKEAGVDYSVILNIATKPSQQKIINDWAQEVNHDSIVSFGSVHPFAPDALEELERIRELGLVGIKLHPDYQDFYVDDDRLLPLYERISQLGLILVFHAGIDIGYPEPIHCTPKRLAQVLPQIQSPVVAAHFGGYLMWHDVEEYLVGKDLYLDTSFSYSRIPPKQARRIIKNHGADRILYGTDTPWSGMRDEIRLIQNLDLSEEEQQKILGENARKLLGLPKDGQEQRN